MALNLVFLVFLLGSCAICMVWGGGPERAGATIYLVGCVLTVLAASPGIGRFARPEVGILLVDTATFAVFLWLALRSDRFWPIWVTALLGIGVLGHVVRAASPGVIPWAYAFVLAIWSYPILLIMVAATLARRRRIRAAPKSLRAS